MRYDSGAKPVGVEKVLISTQHEDGVEAKLADALWEQVVTEALPPGLYDAGALRKEFYVNPTGRFVIGGPVGDTGLTGRKIIVDTYGGFARHGGGAFSGKDPSKVDRSASYAARHVAKNIVAAGPPPGGGPGRLRDRRRPAAVPAHRDLRHREGAPAADRLAWSATTSTCGPPPWSRPWTERPAVDARKVIGQRELRFREVRMIWDTQVDEIVSSLRPSSAIRADAIEVRRPNEK